jgi:spore coat protein I
MREEFIMSEKLCEVYEEYDLEVLGTGRGRGAAILKTDKGIRQLMPFSGSEERLKQEKEFKDNLYDAGFIHIDRCIETKENELISWDRYGNPYVLREYYEGRDCSSTSIYDLGRAAENLAIYHIRGREIYANEGRTYVYREPGSFQKKILELKKIRSYISTRPTKCDFELLYMEAFDDFYEQAAECMKLADKCSMTDVAGRIGYCHGSYNYHSIIFCEDYIATVNFDRFHVGYQLIDIYQFIRKVMEKNNYNFNMAVKIIEEYDRIIPLSKEDYRYIYILYSFPEKFWKISNRYMNSKKSWISPANMEKLKKVIKDEDEKQRFLKDFSEYYEM